MSTSEHTQRLEQTLHKIDEYNSADPNRVLENGESRPWELVHARAMTRWIEALEPNPSEALRIAARSQHIGRWKIPRDDYPRNRKGYHQWRNALKQFHADVTADIMASAGYDEATIERVRKMNRKEGLQGTDPDPEVQCIEDALSLTFMEYRLEQFATREGYPEDKVVNILRKTMKKMSPAGLARAQTLEFSPPVAELVQTALEQFQAENQE